MFFKRKKLFNHSLKILVGTNAIILTAAAMLGPIYALFIEEIGGDLMDAAIAGAIFALAAGVTTLISGKYADHIEKKRIVAFGYLLMALGFFLLAWAQSIYTLFAIQALIGLGEAIYSPPFDALYSNHLDAHKQGRQWSIWESTNYFTMVIGALIGGYIATELGFSALFYTMAALCSVSAIYLLVLPKRIL